MKTDKFEESIRQKLEGIDPPFRESNWVHLRSVLRRNGVPSLGGTVVNWAVPMLSAASVAGLLILTVWQYRTNQQLAQTVRSLKDSVTILQQAPPETPVAEAPKPDTVYITREVLVPKLIPVPSETNSGREDRDERSDTEQLANDATDSQPNRPDSGPESTPNLNPDSRLLRDRSGQSERLSGSKTENRRNETDASTPERELAGEPERNAGQSSTGSVVGSKSSGERWNPKQEERYSGRQKPSGFETTRPLSSGGNRPDLTSSAGNSGTRTESEATNSISWEPVLSRKLLSKTLALDSNYYVENYQRRVRRIRPLNTPSVNSPAVAKAKQPDIEEPTPFFRFRFGGGGEVAGTQSGFGIAGEFLLGKHFALGIGLNRIKLQGTDFLNDIQYNIKRQGDFRRDFPGKVPLDPRIEVLNITQKAKSWQLPLTATFRLPIGNDVTILPSAGASLSLNTLEQITFTHRKGPSMLDEFKQASLSTKCQPNLYNSWLVSLGVEKQAGNWALQLMPFFSNPMKKSRNSLNQTTAGFRARIMYQF